MDRNHLGGGIGDELNVIFAAAGFNFRKLLRAFALFFCQFLTNALKRLFARLFQEQVMRFCKKKTREEERLLSNVFHFSYLTFA